MAKTIYDRDGRRARTRVSALLDSVVEGISKLSEKTKAQVTILKQVADMQETTLKHPAKAEKTNQLAEKHEKEIAEKEKGASLSVNSQKTKEAKPITELTKIATAVIGTGSVKIDMKDKKNLAGLSPELKNKLETWEKDPKRNSLNPNGIITPGEFCEFLISTSDNSEIKLAIGDYRYTIKNGKVQTDRTEKWNIRVSQNKLTDEILTGTGPKVFQSLLDRSNVYTKLSSKQKAALKAGKAVKINGFNVNLKDGIEKSEWDALKLGKKQAFNLFSVGGDSSKVDENTGKVRGDGKITDKDWKKSKNELINLIAKGTGSSPEVIDKYLEAERYALVSGVEAADKFMEGLGKSSDASISGEELLAKISDNYKPWAEQVLRNLLGVEKDLSKANLNREIRNYFFTTMKFLARIKDPKKIMKGIKADEFPKLSFANSGEFVNKVTGGKVKVEKDEDEGTEGGELNRKQKQTLLNMQLGNYKGTQAEAIKDLEAMKKNSPTHNKVRKILLQKYAARGMTNKALTEAIFLYEKDPGDERVQKMLIGISTKYASKAGMKGLNEKEKANIEKAYSMLKAIKDSETLEQKIKDGLNNEILPRLAELKYGNLPGETKYKEIVSKKDMSLIKIREASDSWIETLSTEINKIKLKDFENIADEEKVQLARMLAQIAKLQVTKLNFEGTRKNIVEALNYCDSVAEGIKKGILKSAQIIIVQLYEAKTIKGKRDRRRIDAAKEIFRAFRKVSGEDVAVFRLSNKHELKVDLEDLNRAEMETPKDYEEVQARTYLGLLVSADEPEKRKAEEGKYEPNPSYRSPDQKRNIALTILSVLDKYRNNPGFFRELKVWARKIAIRGKNRKYIKQNPKLDPRGHFKDYEAAVRFIVSISKM
ncbi:hypothetical protein ACFL52_04555 [Candidatus Margulisiibacteriota bacterium]